MRIFISLIILFAVAIGLAVTARFNTGNVVLFYPPYRVDLSLNFFLLLGVLLFMFGYATLNALRKARGMPARVAAYRREKREREANRALREALRALFEGRFGHAEKAAQRAMANPENTGLSALIAARAAHRIGHTQRRDQWLAKVQENGELKTARLMTAIELMIDEREAEGALDAARELNATGTRQIHALRLALKANQRAHNWPEVLRLVRLLDKRSALHPMLSRRLREMAYEALLVEAAHDAESLQRTWSDIPADDRVQPFVAVRAARAFTDRGLHDEARAVIEKSLEAEWDDRLVRAYRHAAAADGSPALLAQIERCEQWLQRHPADAELSLTLGVLCLKQKLWGKAQRHLEEALSQAGEAPAKRDAHLHLARLHEALNQLDAAASHYRESALAGLRQ